MVAGHVREKKGYFYAVLNYTDVFGNRKTKWIATGLPVKGNKKRAEAFLQEQRRKFVQDAPPADDMLFADFMEQWLEVVKTSIAVATYASYTNMVKKVISPYFREKGITLKGLTAKDIQDFYLKELERVSAASVIHYHSNIHKALKYAVKLDLIPGNPADKVERPKKEKFSASFYDADEINKLFEISKGTKLEIPILLGAFYGLRRSEAIGLKWDAVDFEHDTITIKHTVTSVNLDGKHILVPQDTTKTKSSRRTLPLVPFVKERLLSLQKEQKENRRLCGRCYNREFEDYICVNEIGDLIKPEYISSTFAAFLEENGMRRIRFHDLRHPYVKCKTNNNLKKQESQVVVPDSLGFLPSTENVLYTSLHFDSNDA